MAETLEQGTTVQSGYPDFKGGVKIKSTGKEINFSKKDDEAEKNEQEVQEEQQVEEVLQDVDTSEPVVETDVETENQPEPETLNKDVQEEIKDEAEASGGEEISQLDRVESQEIDVAELTDGVFGSIDEIKEFAKLLKEDEYLKGAIDYYKTEGTLLPYLEVMNINPAEMSTVDLLRADFEAQYKGLNLSKSDLDVLFEEEVLKAYKLDESDYDERDVRIGKIRADKKANEIRQQLLEVQNKFKQPVRDEQPKVSQEEIIAERNKRRKQHSDSLASLLKDGTLSMEVADQVEPLPLKVSKDKVIGYAMDFTSFAKDYLLKDGKPDYAMLTKLTSFASDPVKFSKDLFDHGFNYGKKAIVDKELKNKPDKVGGQSPVAKNPTLDPYKANPKDFVVKRR